MNNLLFLIYVAGMSVFFVLERQRSVQMRELALEYARLGARPPLSRPRIRGLESVLNISIGVILTAMGGGGAWVILQAPQVNDRFATEMWTAHSVMAAAGLTLIVLGARALRDNIRFRKISASRGSEESSSGPHRNSSRPAG